MTEHRSDEQTEPGPPPLATQGTAADPSTRRRLARKAVTISAIAIALAALVGYLVATAAGAGAGVSLAAAAGGGLAAGVVAALGLAGQEDGRIDDMVDQTR